jgi:hypothetical protein
VLVDHAGLLAPLDLLKEQILLQQGSFSTLVNNSLLIVTVWLVSDSPFYLLFWSLDRHRNTNNFRHDITSNWRSFVIKIKAGKLKYNIHWFPWDFGAINGTRQTRLPVVMVAVEGSWPMPTGVWSRQGRYKRRVHALRQGNVGNASLILRK